MEILTVESSDNHLRQEPLPVCLSREDYLYNEAMRWVG